MSDAPELRRAVKAYLDAISRISRVGTPELSHYTALDNLFDAIGDQLKPKVRAVVHHSEAGGDQPDLGLFSAASKEPLSGSPDRGVVEVKGSEADLDQLIASEQVAKYWRTHKLVLVTNLRQFALVGENSSGTKTTLERCALAETDAQFEELLKHTTRAANRHGVSLGEYLARAMEHTTVISEPRDLARLLASYARDALQRVERAVAEEDSLQPIREALEQALGMRFEDERAEEFFRSTLVQTLFYGVFAAWVLWARAGKTGRFRWKDTVDYLRAPVLRMLFHQLTDPGRLERLELVDVLDWTEAALERVNRDEFLKRFSQGEAVQYFYEPFLEAFDPALRKQLGVWYTPREVVRYMVARVDRALRDDLGIAKGLADDRVYVLDPCCGTGAFLVETLRRIAETEQAAGPGAGGWPSFRSRMRRQCTFGARSFATGCGHPTGLACRSWSSATSRLGGPARHLSSFGSSGVCGRTDTAPGSSARAIGERRATGRGTCARTATRSRSETRRCWWRSGVPARSWRGRIGSRRHGPCSAVPTATSWYQTMASSTIDLAGTSRSRCWTANVATGPDGVSRPDRCASQSLVSNRWTSWSPRAVRAKGSIEWICRAGFSGRPRTTRSRSIRWSFLHAPSTRWPGSATLPPSSGGCGTSGSGSPPACSPTIIRSPRETSSSRTSGR